MTSRRLSSWFDENDRPIVAWETLVDPQSFEDDVITKVDAQRYMRDRLTPKEMHALAMCIEGYSLSASERMALTRARRKLKRFAKTL